jgi:hypothetical protein
LLDEIEFNELYNRVADVIVKWLGIKSGYNRQYKPILLNE